MAEAADGRTLQLFPAPYNESKPSHEKQDTQTLTIFYQGRALEFEGFPADKVKELMVFPASNVSSPVQENKACTLPEMEVTTEQSTVLDLPIIRKVSLQRFLQKRKHRASTTESYLKGLTSQPPLEKDVTDAGNELKYDIDTTNWLRL
ncbi:hypothetical protein QOZ80_2BG0178370 [Eleusine coracana subsp. coracana]|nr:hypothetical protein QOZ80_2BG0178370 [Eleusine coracana subsp. coracana]